MEGTLLRKGNSGMMEKWNNGVTERKQIILLSLFIKPIIPIFQYSMIPGGGQ
jgi:hypothetical protein